MGFRFFDIAEALAEIEQEKRVLCAPFGGEVLRNDMLLVRMIDTFSWGPSVDEQLEQMWENMSKAMEQLGEKLVGAIAPMVEALAKVGAA